jgi:hypothetical protein
MALLPTTPPPKTTALADATPGKPDNKIPLPPCAFSKQCAPAWIYIRPATSLIGANRGKPPRASVTVS